MSVPTNLPAAPPAGEARLLPLLVLGDSPVDSSRATPISVTVTTPQGGLVGAHQNDVVVAQPIGALQPLPMPTVAIYARVSALGSLAALIVD